ncbi:caspase-8 [Scomber scombrus]|uniref:Caspase-8 n=1 Tax=Scomber scombrus TaxID=13677 RepID=A0AAV1MZ80_SCOSC|nr:caspase-8 [Scomber scombrus]
MMDRLMLSRIDEELESSEVAALCFLCLDVVNRKRLHGIRDAKDLFLRLEEKGLMDNSAFLYQLLDTIQRRDLLSLLETDSRQPEETDANPVLSDYRVMLYQIYEDITQENFGKMQFLLHEELGRKKVENCKTPLDLFDEMEKAGLLSNTNLHELINVLSDLDRPLASIVKQYQDDKGARVYSDAEPNTQPSSSFDPADYYSLTHNPRGVCMVINNELFLGAGLKRRAGAQEDTKALQTVFNRLGFKVEIHKDLTAEAMRRELKALGTRNFLNDDALVVCMLSHGENGTVFGTDEQRVYLKEMREPFKSGRAPTLAGKPKLFFVQACQGEDYQRGSLPCPPRPREDEGDRQEPLETDAGRIEGETVPWDADFLLGMATVPNCKSFRNTTTGSIYIQELCRQLTRSAESLENDDILTVLTRVNREVSKGVYLNYKQMPEPKYTLTKKLVLKYV